MATTTLPKGARLTDAQRDTALKTAKSLYDQGKSIREISEALGRSYGAVHRLLVDNDVELRPRGGGTRKGKPRAPRKTKS